MEYEDYAKLLRRQLRYLERVRFSHEFGMACEDPHIRLESQKNVNHQFLQNRTASLKVVCVQCQGVRLLSYASSCIGPDDHKAIA